MVQSDAIRQYLPSALLYAALGASIAPLIICIATDGIVNPLFAQMTPIKTRLQEGELDLVTTCCARRTQPCPT